jgi:hypothetical protein
VCATNATRRIGVEDVLRKYRPKPSWMTGDPGYSFPLPFGRRHSLFGHPSPAGELGPPHGRLTGHASGAPGPRPGFPRSARTSCDRGGRPLCPGDNGAHPDRGHFPAGARRFAATSSFPPPTVPPARMLLNEASTKGSRVFARRVFRSPVAARMERAALGLEPRASHPADQEPDDARRGGGRPSSTDLELLAQLTLVDLQSGSSLVMCDLASHVAKRSSGAAPLAPPASP